MRPNPVATRLAKELVKAVDAEAKRRMWSRSSVIQACVERSLPDLESEAFGKSLGKKKQESHEKCGMVDWQPKMVEWVRTRLGDAAMASHERGMRYGEESFELLQAIGLTKEQLIKLMDHVFSKEPGRVGQEIGGVVTTLLTLAEAQNADMNIAALMEIDRIHALPPEKFRKRH